jgi:phosphatidylserine/phosphatidylglycerophosphate/cardiolipin synthase-like enzyme
MPLRFTGVFLLTGLAGWGGYLAGRHERSESISTPQTRVLFSPHGGCTEAIITEISNAKSSILVQAYSFTSEPIAQALVAAHKRGVKVQVLVDKGQLKENGAKIDLLANASVPLAIDSKHNCAHNKVLVIDGKIVITGSFNFSASAENRNAENLVIIQSEELAAKYTVNWKEHEAHCELYGVQTK